MHPHISISFAPAWWHHHYGISFDQHSWQDPVRRTELNREQRRLLFDRFGDVGLGDRNPQPQPTVGIEYGDRFMAALWDCDIRYLPDQAPSAIALYDSQEQMRNLAKPNVKTSPVIQQALADMRTLQEKYGYCSFTVNYGGPLNNAVSVFGAEILTACILQPEMAQSVLRAMGQVVLDVHGVVSTLAGSDHTPLHDEVNIGNCPVCMISPTTYEQVVLPVDLWLAGKFSRVNLHHCGVFDKYAEAYTSMHPASLDIGPGSDLNLARHIFPSTPFSTYIDVGRLAHLSQPQIDQLIITMCDQAGAPDIFHHIRVADIGPEISDETIRYLLTVFDRV